MLRMRRFWRWRLRFFADGLLAKRSSKQNSYKTAGIFSVFRSAVSSTSRYGVAA